MGEGCRPWTAPNMMGALARRGEANGGLANAALATSDADAQALLQSTRKQPRQSASAASARNTTPGRLDRKALPVLHRSPSWPPMKFDFHEELRKVQKPRTVRKAVLFALLIIVNNVLIVVAASFVLRGYLQVSAHKHTSAGGERGREKREQGRVTVLPRGWRTECIRALLKYACAVSGEIAYALSRVVCESLNARLCSLQVETSESFGPGLVVKGRLSADSINIAVDGGQQAVFRSQSSDSAIGIHSATSKTSKLILVRNSRR